MTLFSRHAAERHFPRWLLMRAKPIPGPPVQQQYVSAQEPRRMLGMIRFTHTLDTSARIQKQRRTFRTLFFVLSLLLLALIVPVSPLPHFVGFGAALGPSVNTDAKDTPSYPATGATATPPPVSEYPASAADNTTSTASSSWIQQALQGFWNSILQGLTAFLQSVIADATTFGFMFVTPAWLTYGHPVVMNLQAWVVLVANGLVGLFLIIGGYNYMFGAYKSFRELAPRFIVAAIAANLSLPILSQFIEVSNTLCTGVLGELVHVGVGNLSLPLGIINWATAPEYLILVYVLDLIVSVCLIVQMLMRIAMLDFLLIVSPLGFLCFALPQTQAWARLWVQAFVSTLIVQFLQVICIGMGSALVASFGHASPSPVTILVGIAALFLAGKLPDMLLSNVLRTSNAQEAGDVAGGTAQKGAEMAAIIAA